MAKEKDWPLTDERLAELIAQVETTPCPQSAYCKDAIASVRFALHIVADKALTELRDLRALLATPMDCGWDPAQIDEDGRVRHDQLGLGAMGVWPDELIAIAAMLMRAALEAKERSNGR